VADLLERMARGSAERVGRARGRECEAAIRRRAAESPPGPRLEFSGRGFDLIAEIKRRAPSGGRLANGKDSPIRERARAYAAAGAAAVSVLTEPEEFRGSLDDLVEIARSIDLPVMRKDFLVDPYQLFEARAAGASGALLIVRMLSEARLDEMLEAATELGLFVLLEAFDGEDLDRARELSPRSTSAGLDLFYGLNSRDLGSLGIDRSRFASLRDRFPEGPARVAESGLESVDDVREVAALGYRAALVGSALMRAADPGRLVAAMIRAGREEGGRSCA